MCEAVVHSTQLIGNYRGRMSAHQCVPCASCFQLFRLPCVEFEEAGIRKGKEQTVSVRQNQDEASLTHQPEL